MNLIEKIFDLLQDKTDIEKAIIAAEILSDCETNNNKIMFAFLDELDEVTKAELYSRIEEYYINNKTN